MTENESIETLKLNRPFAYTELQNAVDMAIQALEKQIPKKPRFYAHNYYCTECGNLVGNNEFEWQRFLYCDNCGQKLDWSE